MDAWVMPRKHVEQSASKARLTAERCWRSGSRAVAEFTPGFNIRKVRCQVTLSRVAKLFMLKRQKDVSDSSLFGSSEIARADADDFEGLVVEVERAAEDVGIAAEAVIPVVPGEDRIGGDTGAAVIGGGEQAAERGLKAEEREHVAGGIHDVGLLHVVVGRPGDVCAVGVADGDEVGLVLDGIAHAVEVRRGPVTVLGRLAV